MIGKRQRDSMNGRHDYQKGVWGAWKELSWAVVRHPLRTVSVPLENQSATLDSSSYVSKLKI